MVGDALELGAEDQIENDRVDEEDEQKNPPMTDISRRHRERCIQTRRSLPDPVPSKKSSD